MHSFLFTRKQRHDYGYFTLLPLPNLSKRLMRVFLADHRCTAIKMHALLAFFIAAVGYTTAQRPDNTSICSYYTPVLFGDNNVTNQYKLLTSLVNTVVIGNYSVPKNDIAVPGILAPGTFNGTKVNLLPYFDGGLSSSNRGGTSGVAVNFLDDGGAAPLKMNKSASGTTSSQL